MGEDSFTFFSDLIWLRFFIFPSYIYTEVFGRQQTCFASLMPKIWALVSNFPVIESASADSITLTTVRSLWGGIHLLFFELDCVLFLLCFLHLFWSVWTPVATLGDSWLYNYFKKSVRGSFFWFFSIQNFFTATLFSVLNKV